MSLTVDTIRGSGSDDDLFEALSSELRRRIPSREGEGVEQYLERIRGLPHGLRAMAAIYELDVSIALDDLGWHFANWHHWPYCEETLRGLRVLSADEAAIIFSAAMDVVGPYWEQLGEQASQDVDTFVDWYEASGLEAALQPLDDQMRSLCESSPDYGLLVYWIRYARQFPDGVLPVRSVRVLFRRGDTAAGCARLIRR